jgi:hypothetical protein
MTLSRKLMSGLVLALLGVVLAAIPALAQSSGNFSAAVINTACVLNTSTGDLTPECTPKVDGSVCSTLSAPIKTSNGKGVTLLVTPSVITGLFTSTKVNTSITSSSADVGIQVCLTVDGTTDGILPAGGCVVYDQRFQQLSSGLFKEIASCAVLPTEMACTVDADCAGLNTPDATYSCDAGFCQGIPNNCNLDLILSTLSAHSFNFVVSVPGGEHTVTAAWKLTGVNTSGNANVAACTGPGTLTVTQTKVFNNSGGIIVQ